jgi:hypothetical protein
MEKLNNILKTHKPVSPLLPAPKDKRIGKILDSPALQLRLSFVFMGYFTTQKLYAPGRCNEFPPYFCIKHCTIKAFPQFH